MSSKLQTTNLPTAHNSTTTRNGSSTTTTYEPTKKQGIFSRLFHKDHQRGVEKELKKEQYHALKAEAYGQKARDANLSDRQQKRYLRKAAKQQASADFHESLKKKHMIGATPGHKDQAIPPMATHHPIIHDNGSNVVKTELRDQNTMMVGAPATDGIAECGYKQQYVYSYPADDESESDISSADERELKDRKALPFSAADLKKGSTNLNTTNDWKNRKAPFTRHQLRAGSRGLTTARTNQRNNNWLATKDLKAQSQKLNKTQTTEKGGLAVFSDEWERRKRWQSNRSLPQQQSENQGWYQYNQFYSQPIRDQIKAGKFTSQYNEPRGFILYASQPALQRKAATLKKTETRQSQGNWLHSKDLVTKSQGLKKVQTIEKGGLKSYADQWNKKKTINNMGRDIKTSDLKAQQAQQIKDANQNVTVTITQSTVMSQ